MMLASPCGRAFAYEVTEHADGYLVRLRNLKSGRLVEDGATLFRTAAVAVRFARLAAALDHCATEVEPFTLPDPINA